MTTPHIFFAAIPWWLQNHSEVAKGQFGVDRPSTNPAWSNCREIALDVWRDHNKPNWYYYSKHVDRIVSLVGKVEDYLKLDHRTQFMQVEHRPGHPWPDKILDNFVYIIPSSFWQRHWLKMSLFLSLVRVSEDHGKIGDISTSEMWKILKHDLLKSPSVFRAVKRFLQGHTTIQSVRYSWARGWYAVFHKTTVQQLEKILK